MPTPHIPPDIPEVEVYADDDPRVPLVQEARGRPAPEEEPEELVEPGEGEAEEEEEDPLAAERAALALKEEKIKREIAKEREKRRRANNKAAALQRQVEELLAAQQPAPSAPPKVVLPFDEDGNPILTPEAIRQVQGHSPKPSTAPKQPTPAQTDAGRDSYESMKDALLDEDPAYGRIFSRLERATKDLALGVQEAVQDGESLSSTEEVLDYLESSDFGSEFRERYPEIDDIDAFVQAIQSTRAARRLAQKLHKGANGARETKEPTPSSDNSRPQKEDLTSETRRRIREKASQTGRARSTSSNLPISLEEASRLSPEEILRLPREKRAAVDKLLREARF